MEPWDLLLRLVLAAVVGLALGLERQRGGHPAGARTHLLVSVGACLFTLAGAYGFADVEGVTPWDPARIAAQVASGIGFIGAGAILRDGTTTRGITTAATLWISGATGVCIGAGLFLTSLAGAALVIVGLMALSVVNGWLNRRQSKAVAVSMAYRGVEGPGRLWAALAEIDAQLGEVTQVREEGVGPDRWRLRIVVEQVGDPQRLRARVADVGTVPGVLDVSVQAA